MSARDFFTLKLKKTTTGKNKTFRKNFKITQNELAQMTKIAETNLSAIENDRIEIGVKRAVLISMDLEPDPS